MKKILIFSRYFFLLLIFVSIQQSLFGQKTEKIFNVRSTFLALREMKLINRELSFAIRTLFFFVFGISMEIEKILKKEIILSGIIHLLLIHKFPGTDLL